MSAWACPACCKRWAVEQYEEKAFRRSLHAWLLHPIFTYLVRLGGPYPARRVWWCRAMTRFRRWKALRHMTEWDVVDGVWRREQ